VGDIRNPDDCRKATEGIEVVFKEAAFGTAPSSIKYPFTLNEVNVSVFLQMLVVMRVWMN
jgi:UDP-N-acetylglucosamine 4-epimerase